MNSPPFAAFTQNPSLDRKIPIFIGRDPRELAAEAVAVDRLMALDASRRFEPIPLCLAEMRGMGLYKRPTETRDGALFDVISGAPMATEFAISRFLVPHLAVHYYGEPSGWGARRWAVFMDCDMLPLADPVGLLQVKPGKALYVVKHEAHGTSGVKMDGQKQTYYGRKNWSSVMVMDLSHPAWRRLSLAMINDKPGRDLHAFCWLLDEEIGELPPGWNWLEGYSGPLLSGHTFMVHMTRGGPWLPGWSGVAYAGQWLEAYRALPEATREAFPIPTPYEHRMTILAAAQRGEERPLPVPLRGSASFATALRSAFRRGESDRRAEAEKPADLVGHGASDILVVESLNGVWLLGDAQGKEMARFSSAGSTFISHEAQAAMADMEKVHPSWCLMEPAEKADRLRARILALRAARAETTMALPTLKAPGALGALGQFHVVGDAQVSFDGGPTWGALRSPKEPEAVVASSDPIDPPKGGILVGMMELKVRAESSFLFLDGQVVAVFADDHSAPKTPEARSAARDFHAKNPGPQGITARGMGTARELLTAMGATTIQFWGDRDMFIRGYRFEDAPAAVSPVRAAAMAALDEAVPGWRKLEGVTRDAFLATATRAMEAHEPTRSRLRQIARQHEKAEASLKHLAASLTTLSRNKALDPRDAKVLGGLAREVQMGIIPRMKAVGADRAKEVE